MRRGGRRPGTASFDADHPGAWPVHDGIAFFARRSARFSFRRRGLRARRRDLGPLSAARAQQAGRRPGRVAPELRDLRSRLDRPREHADRCRRRRSRRPRRRSSTIRASSRAAAGTRFPRAELKIGSKSKAVQALRQRLVASGDLDRSRAWGRSSIPSSKRRSSASRSATGSSRPATSTTRRSPQLNVAADARLQQLADQHRPAARLFGRSWPALRDGQHSGRRSRDGGERRRSIPTTPPASARSTASRRSCRPRRPRSISTRSGRCRRR